MGCAEIRENLGAFAVGGLEPDELAGVLRHLERCPACREELRELQEVAEALAVLPTSPEPPAHLKAQVLSGMREESAPHRSLRRRAALPAALAALLLAVFAWFALVPREPAAPVAVVRLKPAAEYSAALAHRGYWGLARFYPSCPGNRRVELRLHNLRPPGPGRRLYQVWLVSKDDRTSAGTFDASPGTTDVWLNAPSNTRGYDAMLITLRKKGEKATPGGEVVLRGRMP